MPTAGQAAQPSSPEPPGAVDRAALDVFLRLSPDAALAVDRAGRIRAVNERAATMFGYDLTELEGQPVEVLLPERMRARHEAHRVGYTDDPHPRLMGSGLDLVGRRKDGGELSVDVSLAPVVGGADGDLVVAAVRDVTEVRSNERAAARLAALVTSSEAAMFSLTPGRVIDSWNPAAQDLLGYEADEILGRPLEAIVPPDEHDHTAALYARVARGERLTTIDAYRLHRDGTAIPVALTLSAILDAAGRVVGFSEVVRNQTERLRMQADLAAARAERELLADRDRIARDLHDVVIQRIFAAGMGVQGVAALLGKGAAVERLAAVVHELDGAIGAIRTSIFTLRHPPDRRDTLRDALVDVGARGAEALGFHPTFDFRGPVDLVVPSHLADHVVEVVREGLSNAARHAAATSVRVTVTADPDRLRIEIHDDGVGVPPDGGRPGLGGLARRAAELGGEFDATAVPDGGTRLRWEAPL